MNGVMDKFKRFMGFPEEGEEYEDDSEEMEDDEMEGSGYLDSQETADYTAPSASPISSHTSKVVNIPGAAQYQVGLVRPSGFDEASSIADHLNAKRTVVLNLEKASKEVSRRLVDFLSGVAYANNGEIKYVSTNTYIITPYNVNIMGELMDELENNGVL